jgi:hypothetical protein
MMVLIIVLLSGPPMHGAFACDAACKLDVCRAHARAHQPAARVNVIAACMDLEPCPTECKEVTDEP